MSLRIFFCFFLWNENVDYDKDHTPHVRELSVWDSVHIQYTSPILSILHSVSLSPFLYFTFSTSFLSSLSQTPLPPLGGTRSTGQSSGRSNVFGYCTPAVYHPDSGPYLCNTGGCCSGEWGSCWADGTKRSLL